MREVFEEAGLECRFSELLGFSDRPSPEDGSPRRTAFVRMIVDYAPDEWQHQVAGVGADAGMVFACRWVSEQVELADYQHEFLRSDHLTA
jgi:8-oxo-dGTP pyrophosphatase MutT (NUDIX family)